MWFLKAIQYAVVALFIYVAFKIGYSFYKYDVDFQERYERSFDAKDRVSN